MNQEESTNNKPRTPETQKREEELDLQREDSSNRKHDSRFLPNASYCVNALHLGSDKHMAAHVVIGIIVSLP